MEKRGKGKEKKFDYEGIKNRIPRYLYIYNLEKII